MTKLIKKYKGCLIFKDDRNKYWVELKYRADRGRFGFDSIRKCKKFIDEMMFDRSNKQYEEESQT